ncbi:MAG: helix-turn-helix transcriptional regulator [Oscillospiraceae bacterium]|nr:helix-turn-helix transcriptional regulator [Oscillospiraceae bacterium]
MNIGTQIKTLRLRRGVTQEAMAEYLGVTAQAVSKWECGSSVPDIGMLPALSAYFGVSIDELFALSDEVRMDRIQNMLWDLRFTNPADMENERQFLLGLARREPRDPEPHCMLAELELHIAQEHNIRAEEYAMEIISRVKGSGNSAARGFTRLSHAMGGVHVDYRMNLHNDLIDRIKSYLEECPEDIHACAWLIAQLLADHRITEARHYCEHMAKYDSSYFLTVHQIKVALAKRDLASAKAMWEQMGKDYPDNWSVWHWIGDFQTQIEDYASAKESYRKAIGLLPKPRYKDPIVSLALTCEMDGDISGALEARRLELEISETEWNCSTGESVDEVRREIARLKKKLKGNS